MNQYTKYIIPCCNTFPKGKSCFYKKYRKCHNIQAFMNDSIQFIPNKELIKELFNSKSKTKLLLHINCPVDPIQQTAKFKLGIKHCTFAGTNIKYI
jgi:hypothetical protein